jgi:hypothetical protein
MKEIRKRGAMAAKISKVELEFVLKAAQAERIPIRVHNKNTHARCFIVEMGRDDIVMETAPDWAGFQSWDRVTGYIYYRSQAFSFKLRVVKVEGQRLTASPPEFACRGLDRNFIRIPPPRGLSADFYLQSGQLSLNFPVCEEYSAVELPAYNDDFDVTSMNGLVESFRKRADAVSSENRTLTFRKRGPVSFEETLISKLGKILYIPSTRSGLSEKDPYPEGRLITKPMEEDYEGTDIFISGSRMERLLAEKTSLNIHSEIWTPVLYYQYVVGYVYMANSGERKISFDINAVDLTYEFAHILAYFLKTHNYFDDQAVRKERTPFKASIIDVSASGLLIAFPQDKLSVILKNQSVVDLEIKLDGYKTHCTARIMRRYNDDKTVFYGLRFDELRNETRRRLYEFLYHQPYDPDKEGEASFAADETLPEMPA